MHEMPETLHGEALRRIAAITRQMRQLENELREAIVAARAVGTPVTRIADEAGLSRDTVYRWLRHRRLSPAARCDDTREGVAQLNA